MAHTLKTETMTITPEKAKDFLAQNTRNRKIKPANLAVVKAALQRGEWKLNGEAIKIARDGTILDGQHRLLACVETGISFRTLVIWDLPDETQETMDTGRARSPKDVLALRGHTNAVALASTALGIIRSEQYSIKAVVQPGSKNPVTTAQIVHRVESEPAIADVARFGQKFGRIGLPGRVASVLFYRLSEIDAEDAEFFFEKLLSGADLEEGSPILALRRQTLSSRDSKGEKSMVYLTAIVIKAWNKFRAGEHARVLKFVPGGANPEKFPEPR